MHILVIAGGNSDEREVSLRSGAAVQLALQAAGYQATVLDPSQAPLDASLATRYQVAFPIIHGQGGEDGILQRQLEAIHIPYVGTGVAASELCFDKGRYRDLLRAHNLPLAEGAIVSWPEFQHHPLADQPFVLKPFDGGSSIDTFIVRDPSQAPQPEIAAAFTRHPKMLLEQLIDGIEITVGVLGEQALPVIEIVPPSDGEFDYENKYNGATQELCPPQHVDEVVQTQAQELARQIHQLCECRHLSRTDIIVTPNNQLVVLETNTLPGMTDQSLFPRAASVAGIDMPSLCSQLVTMVADHQTDAA
jgi:D-alanine-D-alanine ligase